MRLSARLLTVWVGSCGFGFYLRLWLCFPVSLSASACRRSGGRRSRRLLSVYRGAGQKRHKPGFCPCPLRRVCVQHGEKRLFPAFWRGLCAGVVNLRGGGAPWHGGAFPRWYDIFRVVWHGFGWGGVVCTLFVKKRTSKTKTTSKRFQAFINAPGWCRWYRVFPALLVRVCVRVRVREAGYWCWLVAGWLSAGCWLVASVVKTSSNAVFTTSARFAVSSRR